MKNAIHAQIMPSGITKGAYESNKGPGGRTQTLQERREMIKYYKNYKRGDRDANISAKMNAENVDKCGSPNDLVKEPNNKLELNEAAAEEYDLQPSVIPVDDDAEDQHDVSDENMAINKYHSDALGQGELNPGSFVQSEEEDAVDGLPEE